MYPDVKKPNYIEPRHLKNDQQRRSGFDQQRRSGFDQQRSVAPQQNQHRR
jgi:hypothetical protein